MSPKKIVAISATVLVIGAVVWIAAVASTMAAETRKSDSMLQTALDSHEKVASVLVKANSLGFDMEPAKTSSGEMGIAGKGSVHPVLFVYRTWLTLTVNGDRDGNATGYHLDREGAFF